MTYCDYAHHARSGRCRRSAQRGAQEANGRLPDPGLPERDIDAWEALVLDVAASRLDRDGTTKRLRALVRRKR